MFEVSDVDSQAVARSAHSVLSPGSAMAKAGRKCGVIDSRAVAMCRRRE
jgi:hypothetical protein